MVQKLKEKDLYKKGSLKKNFKPKPSCQIIGQEKALEVLNFTANLSASNTHLVCLGPKGVGRTSLTLDILHQFSENKPAPSDWIYVANFSDLLHPIPISLPAGQGSLFSKKMSQLVENIKENLQSLFTNENYQISVAHIRQKYITQKQTENNKLKETVETPFTTLSKTQDGIIISPVKEGKILTPDIFNSLPIEERKFLLNEMKKAQNRLEKVLKESTFDTTKETEEIHTLNVQLVEKWLDKKLTILYKNYDSFSDIKIFLTDAKKYILENLNDFLSNNEDAWRLLKINTLVKNNPQKGVPVIAVGQLTIGTLLGRIEREQRAGSLISDHTLIQPGALHLANGGFLVIEGKDLLNTPQVWQSLKRALYTHQIQLNNSEEGVFSVKTLVPKPISLNVKVILVGDTGLYYTLINKEEDFEELFKLQARFEEKTPRTLDSEKDFANVLADFIKRNKLLPFKIEAYNRLIEFSSRLAQDQNELSIRFTRIHDLMREADFIAKQKNLKHVGITELNDVLKRRTIRLSSSRDEWLETIKKGLLKLDLSGMAIGQINALVVHELGVFQFGRPSRVTCRVRLGNGNVADIEREVSLGGTLHSKGVLILSAYLSAKYGQEYTLPIDASLVWEQSYSELDGDSASSAELYALLSAIGGIPINQGIAVTGSVNQMGEIQAVGAINEKIEGFYDACVVMGLTGNQGVLIPENSVSNLMLSERVREAVINKKFHIWTVKTIEDGFTFLTGLTTSQIDKKIHETLSHYHYLSKK